jgi:hypothetical protein
MSASSSLSGKSAEPIVTEPGSLGNGIDEDWVALAGGESGIEELPLRAHAAVAIGRVANAMTAMSVRIISLLDT